MALRLSLPMHGDVEFQSLAIIHYRVRDETTPYRIVDHLEYNATRMDIARYDLSRRFLASAICLPLVFGRRWCQNIITEYIASTAGRGATDREDGF